MEKCSTVDQLGYSQYGQFCFWFLCICFRQALYNFLFLATVISAMNTGLSKLAPRSALLYKM